MQNVQGVDFTAPPCPHPTTPQNILTVSVCMYKLANTIIITTAISGKLQVSSHYLLFEKRRWPLV